MVSPFTVISGVKNGAKIAKVIDKKTKDSGINKVINDGIENVDNIISNGIINTNEAISKGIQKGFSRNKNVANMIQNIEDNEDVENTKENIVKKEDNILNSDKNINIEGVENLADYIPDIKHESIADDNMLIENQYITDKKTNMIRNLQAKSKELDELNKQNQFDLQR